ncbi:hypothetical protein O181_041030 [Austropuccinia psidii MF-1]|uniref:Uncharacterized protein n=1 Tax=Austropuccinia psidii MF-1 TaxID=1389203 RepID=A0A9Q3DE68_9BASI|nr:hypothetical protein [Austropuccinia psidii MF-1]
MLKIVLSYCLAPLKNAEVKCVRGYGNEYYPPLYKGRPMIACFDSDPRLRWCIESECHPPSGRGMLPLTQCYSEKKARESLIYAHSYTVFQKCQKIHVLEGRFTNNTLFKDWWCPFDPDKKINPQLMTCHSCLFGESSATFGNKCDRMP